MISAVIVAGGKSTRMGMNINKQFIKLNGIEIIARTLGVFNDIEAVDEIILVAGEEEIEYCTHNIINKYSFEKVRKIVAGGRLRQDSVYNGLRNCSVDTEIVLIHDGARPFVTEKMIIDSIECTKEHGACAVAVPVKDTIKVVSEDGFVIGTPKREELYMIQTPQTFKFEMILRAHERCSREKLSVTDDTMLVEAMGEKVKIVEGSYFNIKLTTPEDLVMGKAILDHYNINAEDWEV